MLVPCCLTEFMFDPSLKMRKKFPPILIFFRSSRHRKIPATTGADSLKSDQTGTTQPTWSLCVTDMSVASRGRSVTIDTSSNEHFQDQGAGTGTCSSSSSSCSTANSELLGLERSLYNCNMCPLMRRNDRSSE